MFKPARPRLPATRGVAAGGLPTRILPAPLSGCEGLDSSTNGRGGTRCGSSKTLELAYLWRDAGRSLVTLAAGAADNLATCRCPCPKRLSTGSRLMSGWFLFRNQFAARARSCPRSRTSAVEQLTDSDWSERRQGCGVLPLLRDRPFPAAPRSPAGLLGFRRRRLSRFRLNRRRDVLPSQQVRSVSGCRST